MLDERQGTSIISIIDHYLLNKSDVFRIDRGEQMRIKWLNWRQAGHRQLIVLIALVSVVAGSTSAHPVSYSYLDLRPNNETLAARLTLHTGDLGRALGIAESELVNISKIDSRLELIRSWLVERLHLEADGQMLTIHSVRMEPIPDQKAVAITISYRAPAEFGRLEVGGRLFPDDFRHQTFVTIYVEDRLVRQDILTGDRSQLEFFTGTAQGVREVIRRFVPRGVHHIFIGPDHLLFLIGLLLPGGATRRLLLIVTAFTAAHSATLSLATLGLLSLPSELFEPAIALSIVYVGIDNLLRRDGSPDLRLWTAFIFGLIHGFGFAGVLGESGLPAEALGWSLFSFNLGIETGQALVMLPVSAILTVIRVRRPVLSRQIVRTGSILTILAGGFWFVTRLVP